MEPSTYISVIGASEANETHQSMAHTVGEGLARAGYELVCGGRGGVMTAAAAGHREGGGRPIGILPGTDRSEGNEHLAVIITTGIGAMRNALVVGNGDAVIAIGGSFGTLSEIALALDGGTPVIGLDTHDVEGVRAVETPPQAIQAIEQLLGR